MPINVVIIDDEVNNIENLCAILYKHCPEVKVLATALNAETGREIILKNQPELVFLDIQMPGKNGFDLLQSLREYSFEVVFVTAFDQYGLQAIKFAALDYLLKPIDVNELKRAVGRAVERNQLKKQNLQLENLMRVLQQQHDKLVHRLALPTQKEVRFVITDQIVHCESSNNYTSFFLASREKIIVSKPIYEYEEILNEYGFIRCHQSHLVNKKFVKSWVKEDGGYLLLQDGTQLPVSRNKRDHVKAHLGF
jgi:two-component system LytT family response regulator